MRLFDDAKEQRIYILSAMIALTVALSASFYGKRTSLEISVMNCEWFFRETGDERLYRTWETDGIIHFMIPEYIRAGRLKYANGDINKKGNKSCRIQFDEPFHLVLLDEYGEAYANDVCFHKSSAIGSMYVRLPLGIEASSITKDTPIEAVVST